PSQSVGGTPGEPNSQSIENSPPIIFNLRHEPIIPTDQEPVTVSVTVRDESPVTVTMRYHTETAPDPQTVVMEEDGDGTYLAIIPPRGSGEIISFHVEASDGVETRLYPLPEAPCLYRVEADFDAQAPWEPTERPLYRLILRESEKAELARIGSNRSESESNAQMNATFISQDGTGLRIHYLVGVRNRGASSRLGPPNNALVVFRSDEPWQGLASLKFNVKSPHSQALGAVLFRRAGIQVADALPARLTFNGEALVANYVQVESFDANYIANHFSKDPNGNLYQVRDDESNGQQGDLQHQGTDPNDYRNTYFKKTNTQEDDWTDLIELTRRLNDADLAPKDFLSALEEVMDVDQWLRMIATDSLLGNREGGLTTAKGDDYGLYRGVKDTRFILVPHDLDTLLGSSTTRSIWSYADLNGLEGFFDHPEVERRYLAAHMDLLDTFFRPELLDPIIDQVLGGWASEDAISGFKQFVRDRREGVLAQIRQDLTVVLPLEQRQGYWQTSSESIRIEGKFPSAAAGSVVVNGFVATDADPREGTWSMQDLLLRPGINHLLVEAYAESYGTGSLIDSEMLEIWYDAPGPGTIVGGILSGPGGDVDVPTMRLIARDSYYPGVPLLIRAELLDGKGNYRRDLWDSILTLRTDREDVQLEPAAIRLYNGVGSALVSIRGAAGGDEQALIEEGAQWRYLDDGTDQGTAWRSTAFDDFVWEIGAGELGYGDGDEATVVGFGDDDDAKFATTYFRHRFQVSDLAGIGALTLRLRYDDAAAVYLNGTEVVRSSNLPAGAAFDAYATADVDDEDAFAVFAIPANLVVSGANVIAVEVHQGDGGSSDISFEASLLARGSIQDAGDFTITASALGLNAATHGLEVSHEVTSLADAPITMVSGTLPGVATTWDGIVRVTGDLTVGAGHVLTLQPGTLVLIDGNPTPLSVDGIDIDALGTVLANGTAERPITFTATDPSAPWGEIHHENGGDSVYRYVNVTRAGHAPRGGHTSTGPAFNIDDTAVMLEHVAVSDIAGKIMETNGSDVSIDSCHFSRAAMGPETSNTSVLVRDTTITEMLGQYREDGITDDNDGIYLHRAKAGTSLDVQGLVVAVTDDDGFDTLTADVEIRESIFRDCADKGVSINSESAVLKRCLMVGNVYGVQGKSEFNTVSLSLDHCTLAKNQTSVLIAGNPESISIRNSILSAISQEIEGPSLAEIAYSLSLSELPGTGNVVAAPRFASEASNDFRPLPLSLARDAADPTSPLDDDGSRADIGRLVALDEVPIAGGTVTWLASQSPIHVRDDLVIPADVTLIVEPGTTVYVAPEKSITVNGKLIAEGTAYERIRFTTDPSLPFVADIKPDLPQAPPHWGGIQFVDSMSPDNRVAYADIGYAQSQLGSIGIIRSQALIDHCTFLGTHLRMVYADRSSVIIQHCTFPDMFAENEFADALGLDNISEHIKGIGAYPANGHFIIQHNVFGTNKGHNDVIDVDSGVRPAPILQVLNNRFLGARDELLDLGGDVYIAGNIFFNVVKDDETSDRGYANAISTGDAVNRATIVASQNLFWDVDHAINLKRNVATIFEYNTVHQVHADFVDRFDNPNIGSVINLYVDEPGATPGDGAYVRGNVLSAIPRVIGNADLPGDKVSSLGFAYNWVDDQLSDITVAQRAETIFDLGEGNLIGAPGFVNESDGDFALASYAGARRAGPFGEDLGMTVRPGVHIMGEPGSRITESSVTLTFLGPGIFAYRYRVNEGPWSEPIPIGDGFQGQETKRTADLTLTDMVPGQAYTVSAIGQDFAGNWQDEAEATVSKSWQIDSDLGTVQLSEVLAANRTSYSEDGQFLDYVELQNPGTDAVNIVGWSISDQADGSNAHIFGLVRLEGGAYHVVSGSKLGFGIDSEGDELYVWDSQGTLMDTLTFGLQASDLALGRVGDEWTAVPPSPGLPNERQLLADPSLVTISEWLGAPEVRVGSDFVELFNAAALPVDLSGWTLSDEVAGGSSFAPYSFIGAQGYGVVRLSIDRLRDTLFLRDMADTLRDFVLTDPQSSDQSQLRNGGTAILPTPGTGFPSAMEEIRLLALLDGLRISEIMFHAQGDGASEFIELQNVIDISLDLTGVRFTEGIGFVFPERVLAPGEQLVLAFDEAAFRQRYGKDAPLEGLYTGRLNNGGEDITLSLPAPYDVAILRFEFQDDWEPSADGKGYSLVANDLSAHPRAWQSAGSWQASEQVGGTPAGRTQIESPMTSYALWQAEHGVGDPNEDPDGDGLTNLEEYAYDTDPKVANRKPIDLRRVDGEFVLEIAILNRPDLVATLELSDDLENWNASPALNLPTTDVRLTQADQAEFIRVRLDLTLDL
ncbi:MAG: hypothetical protein ACI8T1_003996, partial [Verrucomicrobiales bacterium]